VSGVTKRAVVIGGLLALAGMLAATGGARAQRPARAGQAAPEITGGPWVGSPPLSLAGLRGRVVLVEFWTCG
jgi:hypothetical protein